MIAATLALLLALAQPAPTELAIPSTDTGAEPFTIHADLYLPEDGAEPRALVLAFHMAGSNARTEYAPVLVPALLERNLAVLTPDLRLGGSRIGGTNRTAQALQDAGVPELGSYCDAYPDLVSVLAYAESWLEDTGQDLPVVAIGSSYTATLVLRLAAEEGDRIDGVASFSPAAGNPMRGCQPQDFLDDIEIPMLLAVPEREASDSKRALLARGERLGGLTHIEPAGVHGSLLLDPQRNTDHDADGAWDALDRLIADAVD
ncbi:MAG: alpha/beta hydrolase [Phycisphaerales bacterium JB040]